MAVFKVIEGSSTFPVAGNRKHGLNRVKTSLVLFCSFWKMSSNQTVSYSFIFNIMTTEYSTTRPDLKFTNLCNKLRC